MKKQIRAIVAVAAATMILTGCATRQQNNFSEQNNTPKNSTKPSSEQHDFVFKHRDDTGRGELVAT